LPLLIVSGASGAGKSTVAHLLMGQLDRVVLLDSDILWRPEFDTPEDNYRTFFETWLRMAKNIAQAGRPVVIFGAGMGVPANIEPCVERRYFSRVDYLALVCEDDVLAERLHARPAWRESSDQPTETHVRFNRWFKDRRGVITLLDTTGSTPENTAGRSQPG
jgi:predicted kinase